jgi:hypothetical protein
MKTTQSLADAARDLLANVNTDNDNNGTYATLQAALDAHDRQERKGALRFAMWTTRRAYLAAPKGNNNKERSAFFLACNAYQDAERE